MSMNVRFGTETCQCAVIKQTPTDDTRFILESPDPKYAYLAWLSACMENWAKDDSDGAEEGFRYWNEEYRRQSEAINAYEKAHPDAEWTEE